MSFILGDSDSLVRMVVVGVLAYLALIAILRISGKRTLSQLNAFDFVVTVALGSTLATILLSRDVSLAEGVFALLILVAMQFAITWSSIRFEQVGSLAKSEPTVLVYRGRYLDGAMRRERVTRREIQEAVRKQGKARPDEVALVVLETDGSMSVIETLTEADVADSAVARLLPDDS